MARSHAEIQADFDRIARLPAEGWDHNDEYAPFLLRQLPARLGDALEIGCGTGGFARRLAERAERVLAIDLSPEMIRMARLRSAGRPNIAFEVADAAERPLPENGFDCVASIATLHHLAADVILRKMVRALKPGGTLLVLDLLDVSGPGAVLNNLAAWPLAAVQRLVRGLPLRPPREVREAWAAHGRPETYLTRPQIEALADAIAPGAKVKRHLFWRYSIVWTKPGGPVREEQDRLVSPPGSSVPPRREPPLRW